MQDIAKRPKKYFSKYKEPLVDFPDLIENQLASYKWLIEEGISEVFKEFSPIKDYSDKKFELNFTDLVIGEPKCDPQFAKENELTYEAQIKVRVKLQNKMLGTVKEQEVFMADLPLMTSYGTFIVNGVERVIVPQLARSAGVFFVDMDVKGKTMFGANIIANRGVWIELESEQDGTLSVRIDKKRKFPVIAFLRVMGLKTDEEIMKAFKGSGFEDLVKTSIEKDAAKTADVAYMEIYKRLRDGDLASLENAKDYINSLFIRERYDISPVGRFRMNQQFGGKTDKQALEDRTLSIDDVVKIVKRVYELNSTPGARPDDIDHLGMRRVRFVGEMLQAKIRLGMQQIRRNIQDRMSTIDSDSTMPVAIINQRPLQARIKEFFTQNQLSQFMDQDNVLAEIEHLRRMSALGPGGLSRERASLEVRDVHTSHYGRVCPIETPEGQNIGLINSLSVYARTNEFGFLETPYRKVIDGKVTNEIDYLSAIEEGRYVIAQANAELDEVGNLIDELVTCREKGETILTTPDRVQYMDVATGQVVSVAASLIPFLEHDDANRALMGANMQRQAVPCLRPEKPFVGTGIERDVAVDSGTTVIARRGGVVDYVDANRVVVRVNDEEAMAGEVGVDIYNLTKFTRSNQNTNINQRPIVKVGDLIARGDVVADGASTDIGELALGQNMTIAFMPWNGYNFEDSILISEKVVADDRYTSIHIEELSVVARDTKLGPEEITRDIPNLSERMAGRLDDSGIVYIGADVTAGDVLVGKVTPKGETQLTPEAKLLRAIFGEKASDVKATSLRVPSGMVGTVIDVQVFTREGIQRDKRAQQIIDDELKRYRLDLNDQLRIVEGDAFQRLEKMLIGQVVNGGPKKLAKGAKITKEYLDDLDKYHWFDIRPADDTARSEEHTSELQSHHDLV